MNILIAPFVNALFGFYYLTHNLGWSIVIVTIIIRVILMPLVMPSLKAASKMRELQPKLNKLKEKFKGDKNGMAKAQMELYKVEGINPLSGCLPQILQIAVLIIFFSAFNMVTSFSGGKGSMDQINNQLISNFKITKEFKFDTSFMGSSLIELPSKTFKDNGMSPIMILPVILLLGSGILQFFSAKLMMPAPKVDEAVVKAETVDKEDDMMAAMRTQSLYVMPLMTVFLGWNFSLGMLLYWFINSVTMIGQQLAISKLNKK